MSTSVLPVIPGFTFPVKRRQQFKTRKPEAISGKETAIADQTIPRYIWSRPISVLRQGTVPIGGPWSELATLLGFMATMLGGFDTFLFTDADDFSVLAQAILNTVTGGTTGDGTTLDFQLQRTFGGFTIPIIGPNTVTTVYDAGSPVSGANYTVNNWGSAKPGVVSFHSGHAPAAGHAVTADFTYYFVCRFLMDEHEFERFTAGRYEMKELAWRSIK